jgi:hypothetical protein
MYDFLNQHQLYIVLSITLISWCGVIWYLFRLERRIAKMEILLRKDK